MLPITRILAPTDFSERSYPALDLAVELAAHFSAELLIAHALTPITIVEPAAAGPVPHNLDIYRDSMIRSSETALEGLVDSRVPEGLVCTTEIVWGSPAPSIVKLAGDHACDLIVMCTRGATGLSRLVMGSVTERVVRLAEVPVLTVQATDED